MTIRSCDFGVTERDDMPKETFLNLPDEKRQLIENTAITEFAARGFDKASINTIVRESGIAKGSFYQYFSDKEDLFLHLLIKVAADKKLKYLSPVLGNPDDHNFFTVIKELFISALRFASENPELERISMWLFSNTNHPVYKVLMKKAGHTSTDVYASLISKAMDRGDIREDVDVAYISHIFPMFISGTMDYCLKASKKEGVAGLSGITDEIMAKVDLMIEVIKDGIGNKYLQ